MCEGMALYGLWRKRWLQVTVGTSLSLVIGQWIAVSPCYGIRVRA